MIVTRPGTETTNYGASLVSTQNHVESPFIIVKIGKYTFGHCDVEYKHKLQSHFHVTYPNYMDSLQVNKINGSINTYTLTMTYAITEADDPNRLEKVFGSISKSRTIYISYGDWNAPSFIYKEEEAIITKLTTRVNLNSSQINYTITCTSTSAMLTAAPYNFPAKRAKPSEVIISLLSNSRYGLTDIFTGMRNLTKAMFKSFIATDDKTVQLEAKTGITIIDYISYLVSCMVFSGETTSDLKKSVYFWSTYDDVTSEYGGTYFKVVRVPSNTKTLVSYNTYEVDVGYPSSSCVIDFSVNNDDSWSILYDYSKRVSLPEYCYEIDDKGDMIQTVSPAATVSRKTLKTTEATRNWWSRVTSFPISATLTLKGLLRPAMLMTYVKVNTYFYGHKHVSSGLYIITKQQDQINKNGYRTTLSLTRVGSDELYA